MFRFAFYIIALLVILLPSCEDVVTREYQVRHDCTGSYLLQDTGDLKVCNPEILEHFSSGDFIDATFVISSEEDCPSLNVYACNAFFPYSEVIYIKEVK